MTQHEHPEPTLDRPRCDCGAPATRRSRDTREYACDTCRPAWMWIADPVALSTEDDGLAGLRAKLDALVASRREEKARKAWRQTEPTAAQVRAHQQTHASGESLSCWQARAYGCALVLMGEVQDDGTVRWDILVPPQARPRGLDCHRVFPSTEWEWRPMDLWTQEPMLWPEVTT